jgi:hypothetical protein
MLFLDPVDLGSDEANAEYRRMIRKPMDFATVRSKLKDKDRPYSSIEAWSADVALIFDNSISFNGESSAISGVARYYKEKLDKYVSRIATVDSSPAEFASTLARLTAEYVEILSHPPDDADLECSIQSTRSFGGTLKVASMDMLADELNQLASNRDLDEVCRILFGHAPSKDDGEVTEIDVVDLDDNVIERLWAVIREKKGTLEQEDGDICEN